MRLIDADALLDRAIYTRNYFEIKSLVERMPTIAPPSNDPLTLEKLREMDGEPVWDKALRAWGLVVGNFILYPSPHHHEWRR